MQEATAGGTLRWRSKDESISKGNGEAKREFSHLNSDGGDEAKQDSSKTGKKLVWISNRRGSDDREDKSKDSNRSSAFDKMGPIMHQNPDHCTGRFRMGVSQRRIRGKSLIPQQEQKGEDITMEQKIPKSPSALQESMEKNRKQLFHAVEKGDGALVKSLCADGASLEWVSYEGMTPLMVSCTHEKLFDMVLILLRLGASLTAYRSGSQGGYALHHAAMAGLTNTVALLLSCGADSLLANDDGQTPLDIARVRGHVAVVRTVEDWICFFRGFLREVHDSDRGNSTSKRIVSKKIWAVVLPTCSTPTGTLGRNELALYASRKVALPSRVILLGNFTSEIQEPHLNSPNPDLIIVDKVTKSKYRFRAEVKGDKAQLEDLYKACTQGPHSKVTEKQTFPAEENVPGGASADDIALARAIDASIKTALSEGIPLSEIVQCQAKKHQEQDKPSSEKPIELCVVCLDAAAEAACVPCGHQVGCFNCLSVIEAKNGRCPVCRTPIGSIVRVLKV